MTFYCPKITLTTCYFATNRIPVKSRKPAKIIENLEKLHTLRISAPGVSLIHLHNFRANNGYKLRPRFDEKITSSLEDNTLCTPKSSSRSTATSARGGLADSARLRFLTRARKTQQVNASLGWARVQAKSRKTHECARAQQTNTTSLLWGLLE